VFPLLFVREKTSKKDERRKTLKKNQEKKDR